ncbi:MAG: ABC transporter permease [Oscillospiraceae bacterium]|jgi:spermidine/putrescine transport system permease protein|nr:ABC transporter permease [Oscillospiraceae bacterium]
MRTLSDTARRMLSAPYLVWSILFIVAPMIFVAYYAFTDKSGAFSLANIQALPDYANVFGRSVWYSVIATLICFIIAYPLALCLAGMRENTQRTLIMLIMLPMWMSFLIRTYAWLCLLQDNGIINGWLEKIHLSSLHMINTPGAVILGMVYNYLPYMIVPLYNVLSKVDKSLLEASHDLGANGAQSLLRVTLPLSLPGIASGITMVFVPSISTFYISQKMSTGNISMIGDVIEQQFQSYYNYNMGAAISLVLMIAILVSMMVMRRFTDNNGEVVV